MTIHRFYIPYFQKEKTIALPREVSWQISKVLRLKSGDSIIIFDGTNHEYTFIISEVTKDVVLASFVTEKENFSEPVTFITLFQALIPREAFEEVLQKATEVGVSQFVPIQTARTIVHVKDISEQKLERWQKIIQEAAEQSERAIVPVVLPPVSFEQAIEKAVEHHNVYIAWEREEKNLLSNILQEIHGNKNKKIALFIGPEGGFTQEEINFAKKSGAKTVSLGPRILRSETAGPIISSLVLFINGDLDTSFE